jgi:hypothetical protein
MSTLALDLQAALNRLDRESATKLERLVRDAIELAQQAGAKNGEVDARGWPVGYWEQFADCLGDERWDQPVDSPPEPTPEW